MKKAEIEEQSNQYDAYMEAVNSYLEQGDYHRGLASAAEALEFVDGMMRYHKANESSTDLSIAAITVILKYSPLLLDSELLGRVQSLLEAKPRIRRKANDDVNEQLAESYVQLRRCHALWSAIEVRGIVSHEEILKTMGPSVEAWQDILGNWETMGLIVRTRRGVSIEYRMVTRFEDEAQAKCPACGAVSRAKKRTFYEPAVCLGCRKKNFLVLM
jgi:hypothetical protein